MADVILVPSWLLLLFGLVLILLAIGLIAFSGRFLENAVLGVVLLILIDILGSYVGFQLKIDLLNVVVSALFGIAGVGLLIILKVLGVPV